MRGANQCCCSDIALPHHSQSTTAAMGGRAAHWPLSLIGVLLLALGTQAATLGINEASYLTIPGSRRTLTQDFPASDKSSTGKPASSGLAGSGGSTSGNTGLAQTSRDEGVFTQPGNTTTTNSTDTGGVPVLDFKQCRAICNATGFPKLFRPECAGCLITLPLPFWVHGTRAKPNPPLARLPIYESGLTAVAALPLLQPHRWISIIPVQGISRTDYSANAESEVLANRNWQGGIKTPNLIWTIGGVSRPAVSKTRALVPPICVEELGWITPMLTTVGSVLPTCPGGINVTEATMSEVDVPYPSIDAVVEALPLPYGAEEYRVLLVELTRDAFATAQGAASAVIGSMQAAYTTSLFLRNVTSKERLQQLAKLYGPEEWQTLRADAIAAAGDLVEVDLMYLQNITSTAPPVHNSSGPWWVVAAHALFKVTDGPSKPNSDSSHTPIFEPVAILLTNQPRDPGTKLVYTPAKSESAYILAALALRQAVTQTGIWIGHFYNLHIHSAAATLALYNTIDPQQNVYFSTHPVRQILDFFADPTYMSEFHTLLFLQGYAAGSGTAAGVPDLLPLWNSYAKHGIVHNDTSWAGNTVPEQLKASGLDEGRFRGNGEEGSFAALPGVAINLALRNKVVAPYAKAVIDAAYPSDAAVAADDQIQAFAAALVSPMGSNLVRINEAGNELKTKAQLAKFIEDFITIVLTHGTGHLQNYALRVLNVALDPPRLGTQIAPDPNGQYSTSDYLKWMPSTGTAARQYTFVANFLQTTDLPGPNLIISPQHLTEGEAPSWSDGNPYYTGPNPQDVTTAHQAFVHAASTLLREWPRTDGLRAEATQQQDPIRLPRVINI